MGAGKARWVCAAGVAAVTLTTAHALAGAGDEARARAHEALARASARALASAKIAGWSRRPGALERAGWRVSAERLEATRTGWRASGAARMSGPGDVFVAADEMEFDGHARIVASGTEGGAHVVEDGWTLSGERIEVELESATIHVHSIGASRPGR